MNPTEPGTQAPWLPAYAGLGGIALVVADRLHLIAGLAWWVFPLLGLLAAAVAALVTFVQEASRSGDLLWYPVFTHRTVVWAGAGAWAGWTAAAGWHTPQIITWAVGVPILAALGLVCQTPAGAGREQQQAPGRDRRHRIIREWEAIARSVTRLPINVTGWEPWENSTDGYRVFLELPAEQGTTVDDLAQQAAKFAAAKRLPLGCAVRVLDHDHQGMAVLDVMTRNSLMDITDVHTEPSTPASINDEFPILTTPRGDVLSVCLRIFSMIIGGTVGSGKTTLLDRIIMWLARCTDAVIWVVDLNGGGVAEPWISAWANGLTDKPVIDWIADNEEEGAAMVAVASAVAKDRKTNREASRRKKAANTKILPLSDTMPGIVIITDEGGEVRQAASLFGQLADQGIARIAQIGRAEGVRAVMSILRGTSDLLNKGLRVVAALRLCLRMEEDDEYYHVLGSNPGKLRLGSAVGAGFLKTADTTRPVLGRTVNVDLDSIDAHSIATGPLRPDLDQWALNAAAKVTPSQVLGGKVVPPELMSLPVMRDAAAGQLYANRWGRYAAKLAEIRGEDYEESEPEAAPVLPSRTETPTLDSWALAVCGADSLPAQRPAPELPARPEIGDARIYAFPGKYQVMPAPTMAPNTAREQILAFVKENPGGTAAADIERAVAAARSRVYDLLKQLVADGSLIKKPDGQYMVPANSASTTA